VHALKLQHMRTLVVSDGRKGRSSSTTQCRAQNIFNDEWVHVLLIFCQVILNSTTAPQHK